jgi:hypothetical protein
MQSKRSEEPYLANKRDSFLFWVLDWEQAALVDWLYGSMLTDLSGRKEQKDLLILTWEEAF